MYQIFFLYGYFSTSFFFESQYLIHRVSAYLWFLDSLRNLLVSFFFDVILMLWEETVLLCSLFKDVRVSWISFTVILQPNVPSWILYCLTLYCYSISGSGISVGIATDYGLDGPGIESWWGEYFRPSRPAVGPTQPPVQWVPRLSRE